LVLTIFGAELVAAVAGFESCASIEPAHMNRVTTKNRTADLMKTEYER